MECLPPGRAGRRRSVDCSLSTMTMVRQYVELYKINARLCSCFEVVALEEAVLHGIYTNLKILSKPYKFLLVYGQWKICMHLPVTIQNLLMKVQRTQLQNYARLKINPGKVEVTVQPTCILHLHICMCFVSAKAN